MIGNTYTHRLTVTEDKLASTVGSGLLRVFATPAMIAAMEQAACGALEPFLQEGQTSVGTALQIEHTAPTPLGMEGFPPFASLSFLEALPPGAAVFDLVYHPRQTALLAAARDRGLTAIGGMELLVQQAILAFSRFTGTALDREAVRRDLLAMVGEK